MRNLARTLFRFFLKQLDLYGLYLLWRSGPLKSDGWFRSFKEQRSVDGAGRPLPWFSYPAIEFVSRRVNPSMSVFEFGSGNGTLWWSSRVREVITVEHDQGWYETLAPLVPKNVRLRQIKLEYGSAYSESISRYNSSFDIIVIDGRDRVNCAKHAVGALKPSGVIIFDNTDRPEYADGVAFLHSEGFRQIPFIGMPPSVNSKNETSVFYRPDNAFHI